jgi:hypothetical protein
MVTNSCKGFEGRSFIFAGYDFLLLYAFYCSIHFKECFGSFYVLEISAPVDLD